MTKCNICKESIIMYNNSLGESLVKHMQAQPCAQTSHLNKVSEDLREAEKEYNRIEKLADKCSDNASKWSPGRSGNGETSNYLNELETIKKDIYNLQEKVADAKLVILNYKPNPYLSKSGNYKCEACNKICSSLVFLEKHKKSCISINMKDWVCKFCDKQFTDKYKYQAHESQCGIKVSCCEGCSYKATTQQSLDKHRLNCLIYNPSLLKCVNENCKKYGKVFASITGKKRHVCSIIQ